MSSSRLPVFAGNHPAAVRKVSNIPQEPTMLAMSSPLISHGALSAGRDFFARCVETPTLANLGPVAVRTDIRSTLGPFRTLPEYQVRYPRVVVEALGHLYAEYNAAFEPLVAKNRDHAEDYRRCRDREGRITNTAVQIDMVGLPQAVLDEVANWKLGAVIAVLRGEIFEIENSLAMYQLLEKICAKDGGDSFFKQRFRAHLNFLKKRFKRPIALLAVTDQKHQAVRESEFGKREGEPLTDEEVLELSGFDRLFGPAEFQEHVTENFGECEYLLYARTSDPVSKLRDPTTTVEHPLLSSPELVRVIRENCLTLNVDQPGAHPDRRINDTKEYMSSLNMAFPVSAEEDFLSAEVLTHTRKRERPFAEFTGDPLKPQFAEWLISRGIDPSAVASGSQLLRAKPAKGTYGCYGHVSGTLGSRDFRRDLRYELGRREGGYVIQPELRTPVITNTADGTQYACIDRNFFAIGANGPVFLGGHRSLMPTGTLEARKGRNHGNQDTVWAEITGD